MGVTQPSVYSAPFDALAARYDQTFSSSLIGQAQRAAVWRELAKTFRPGDRILEIGCGTGVDACFMAEREVSVIATDSSPEMIRKTADRVRAKGFQKIVRPLLLRAEDIARLSTEEKFDAVFSNFGALNCVEDLRPFAQALAGLLRPGAPALLCWMSPHCAWEIGWYLAQGNLTKALRRLNRDGVNAKLADEAFVRVHYPSVRALARAFAPEFHLKVVKGIGVAVPPSYLEPWAQRHPRMLQACERADAVFARCPGIRLLGDHVLVRLQRANQPAESA